MKFNQSIFVFAAIFVLPFFTLSAQNKTLLDKNGDRIRAVPFAIGKAGFVHETIKVIYEKETWINLKKLGYNTVRICWVDPYFQMKKESYGSVDEVLPIIDNCVKLATENGVNLIIDYHNVAEYEKTKGFGMMVEFWNKIAPRYKDNDLVFYELNNEQAWSEQAYLSSEFKNEMKDIYQNVRKQAPKRQIIMFSFHSLILDMKSIVDTYNWIDWDYTVVGWHFYGSQTGDKSIEERNMLNLITNYRTICTEWNYPGKYNYIKNYFGYTINAKPLEYYGISWADWKDWHDCTFDHATQLLIPDAKANNYYWKIN